MIADQPVETYEAGRVVGAGSFTCSECGFAISLAALDRVPECPSCGSRRFLRASLFEQPTLDSPAIEPRESEPAWLARARDELHQSGHFLAFEDGEETTVVRIDEGWMRIGRSAAADLQLDDPTVSRRHAVVIKTEEGEVRVLDDRSLNGVFVNGEATDWEALSDGDELAVGRYRLYLIDAERVSNGVRAG